MCDATATFGDKQVNLLFSYFWGLICTQSGLWNWDFAEFTKMTQLEEKKRKEKKKRPRNALSADTTKITIIIITIIFNSITFYENENNK